MYLLLRKNGRKKGTNQSQQGKSAKKITLNIVTFIHVGYLCPLYGMAAHCNCSQLHCQEEWTVFFEIFGVFHVCWQWKKIG